MSEDKNFKFPQSMNEWADFWRYTIGVNVIPADTRNKRPIVEWKPYQDKPVPLEIYEYWKRNNMFENGMAIIAGKIWHNDSKKNLYLILVDLDNQKGIDEFCTRDRVMTPLTELAKSKSVIVEQHRDQPDKAHIMFFASHPFPKKSSDVAALSTRLDKNQIPAIEVKGAGEHGLLFVTPSPHKNGHNYEIIGTTELDTPVDAFESHIDNICSKYGIPYLNGNGNTTTTNNLIPIAELDKPDTIIYEGHNRHQELLRKMESVIRKNYTRFSYAEEELKQIANKWNQQHCEPPLDAKQFDKQWRDAIKFIAKQIQISATQARYPELRGNTYYQINETPEKYVIAYKQKNQLIEATGKSSTRKVDGIEMIEYCLVHNKTYLACIPDKIVRHKNPITYLDVSPKFTFSFVDATGERYTFSHKTLSEILSGLRDLGYVLSDGADTALGAMVQAYKESKEIEDNDDMEYIGFFTDKDNKIIASNIEIKEPVISMLDNALSFIEELKQYFETRLDLLSTSIVWGLVAPTVFMLKTNNYFLKWPHFYGFPNATKSNTGKIILALDGHHDNPDFLLNVSRIDTIARLGDVVSHTTYPKLVDEVDVNSLDKTWLVNALKSCIESRIARSKFLRNNAATSTGIPALSPLILTSNPPPPFHDSGYMRRVIERNFPKSETWKESDPTALRFKGFLRLNLNRLKALGDFRNWFIMNNQGIILDEARPPPLDLGFKILEEAYKRTGRNMPDWLALRLPENQLEESIEDNGVMVKGAFEKYIDEQISKALPIWRLKLGKNETLELPNHISDRLVKLAKSNLLPEVKALGDFQVIMRKGILTELYNHGVTRDQLPNLKALADYMEASYKKSHGNKVVHATIAQLSKYFDEIEKLE